jgi:Meiotically up-regulated gene 113
MAKRKTRARTIEEIEADVAESEREERERLDTMFADNAEWLLSDQRHGYVYFIESDMKIKIGCARDVRLRIRELQCGNPNEIELRDAIADDDAFALEALLHRFFSDHRENGEWHTINADDLEKVAKNFEEWAAYIANAIRLMYQ